MLPRFARMLNGDLRMGDSKEADKGIASSSTAGCMSEKPEEVEAKARKAVLKAGGNANNKQHLQGMCQIQFGKYRGQTFKWMLENCLGYAGWLVDDMRREPLSKNVPLSVNKHTFKEYVMSFPEGTEAVLIKRKRHEDRLKSARLHVSTKPSMSGLPASKLFQLFPPDEARRRLREGSSKNVQVQPKIPAGTKPSPRKSNTEQGELSDDALASAVESIEAVAFKEPAVRKPQSVTTLVPPSRTMVKGRVQSDTPVKTCNSGEALRKGGSVLDVPSVEMPPSTDVLSLDMPPMTGATSIVASPTCIEVESCSVLPLQRTTSTCKSGVALREGGSVLDVPSSEMPPSTDVLSSVMPPMTGATSIVASPTCTEVESCSVLPPQRTISTSLQQATSACPIVESWKSSLPEVDIQWISRAIFSMTSKGKPELDDRKIDRLWFYPPNAQLVPTSKPRLDRYFGHRLFLWMPNRILKMKLICTNCNEVELTRQGPYRLTRMVLDVDDYYILAGEWLHCGKCKKNWISWSDNILNQLDPGTRSKFPIQMLYKTACDNRVIFLLHQRGLGNSPSQLQKKINELHNTAWTTKQLQYLSDCSAYSKACKNRLVAPVDFDEPPRQIPVPKYQWFIRVYCQEVKERLDEVKASITSVFGKVLKLDSTKKITKKLAGEASRTAGWATSISNEHGQVLQCVLTVGDGEGIARLVEGVVARYNSANVNPPVLLYVDSHCCGKNRNMETFLNAWPDMIIRLDIWHFMRRLATCVTTDTHRLYGAFMGQLSHAIFQWDKSDLALLKTAKRSQLVIEGKYDITEADVIDSITRKEMALHCRRSTRGTEQTTNMLQDILEMLDSDQGKDTMGVPLFHHERLWEEWKVQKTHIKCLQDPCDIPLYTKTGTLKKGLVELPVYRCARGSTSLESFHLHRARFIPGTSANANNFQAYLLEGLMRWNEDRAAAATSTQNDAQIYSAKLRHMTNSLSEEILGKKIFEQHRNPMQYTGELLGIEYLFNQTGKAFSVEKPGHTEDEDIAEEDEGFGEIDDLADPTVYLAEPTLTRGKADISSSPARLQTSAKDIMEQNRPSRNLVQLPPECDTPDIEVSAHPPDYLRDSSFVPQLASVDAVATVSRAPDRIEATTETIPEEFEGPYNSGGYDRVVSLAEYLYNLLDKAVKAISVPEAEQIIALWNALPETDKSPTKFRDRYKPQLIKGRFKAPKQTRTELLPGVQSVKRCALSPHLGPASWPDSNRYQEALISRLCLRYPSSTSKDGRRQARWNLVLTAYNTIREMLFNCPRVMRETRLQLADISQRTLTAWFSARGKRRERETLEQGLQLPSAPAVAPDPLVAALEKPQTLQLGSGQPIHFVTPENTSGQRKKTDFPKGTAVVKSCSHFHLTITRFSQPASQDSDLGYLQPSSQHTIGPTTKFNQVAIFYKTLSQAEA